MDGSVGVGHGSGSQLRLQAERRSGDDGSGADHILTRCDRNAALRRHWPKSGRFRGPHRVDSGSSRSAEPSASLSDFAHRPSVSMRLGYAFDFPVTSNGQQIEASWPWKVHGVNQTPLHIRAAAGCLSAISISPSGPGLVRVSRAKHNRSMAPYVTSPYQRCGNGVFPFGDLGVGVAAHQQSRADRYAQEYSHFGHPRRLNGYPVWVEPDLSACLELGRVPPVS